MSDDIHVKRAAKIFGVPEEDVTPEMREKAKTFNHQSIYGLNTSATDELLELESANILTHRIHPRQHTWAPDRCDACGKTGEDLKRPCPIPRESSAVQQNHS